MNQMLCDFDEVFVLDDEIEKWSADICKVC